jgi:nickel-dependent lactate racemase
MADIAITTNGGYPLDQNVYQAVKGMTAAEATVKEGGVIIMLAQSADGHGGEGFYRLLTDEPDVEKNYQAILSHGRNETYPDQWQAQILLRILRRAKVLYLSDMPDDMVRAMHMTPIHSLEEGLEIARTYLQNPNATVTAIPDGISVMVTE